MTGPAHPAGGWLDGLEALDDAVAVRVHRLMGEDASALPDYRFDVDDYVVLSVSRAHRRAGLAASVVLVGVLAAFAVLGQVLLAAGMLPVAVGIMPSSLSMRVQLDAFGVTYRYVSFLPAEHTPWREVDRVVTTPWPAMWPPHVQRRQLPRRVPLRGQGLKATGGDPVACAIEMDRRREVPVLDAP